MPVSGGASVSRVSEAEFKRLAYAVTGLAFEVHSALGNLFSEEVYKRELARRCQRAGFRVGLETPVVLEHRGFRKELFIDLLVDDAAVFELKTLAAIGDVHRAQTLDYQFLADLNRAKLFNFRPDSLEHEFVSTTLTTRDRRQFRVNRDRWQPLDEQSAYFSELLIGLLGDWGAFLRLPRYYEAISHFFGGRESVVRSIPVLADGVQVSSQQVHLLNPGSAFKITAVERLDTVESQIRRFLKHTPLRAVQWANLYHHDLTLTTIVNR